MDKRKTGSMGISYKSKKVSSVPKEQKSANSTSTKKSNPGRSSDASRKSDAVREEIHPTAAGLFRVTNPDVSGMVAQVTLPPGMTRGPGPDVLSDSDSQSQKKGHDEYLPSEPSESFEKGEIDFIDKSEGEDTHTLDYESRENLYQNFLDDYEEMEGEVTEVVKTRSNVLREMWESISEYVKRTFDCPSRVFKLRGYHSEPNLSIPFEDKFDVKFEPPKRDGKLKLVGKSISYEDIISPSGKDHPSLLIGSQTDRLLFKSYAIDDKMENAWKELFELEKKRFSFFDELFAMGYVVDSLEVLSNPPLGEDGLPVTLGEYFIEADERHYRKKVDYGRVIFKTKHMYTGNFQDWYFEGPGRYSWQDGTVYQGEFHQGLMHGPGSIHWPDGCIYEGHFIDGMRTGWGVYSSSDGHTFAGEWSDGLPHGRGKMWYDPQYDDNDYYEGEWEHGVPHGFGTRQYATGDRYIGNWEGGQRNGYGIMIWLDERQIYKGGWLDGVPHGSGKHVWYLERTATSSFPTRHVYQGQWVTGRREGIGKMIYPCGSVYEGRWKNGQRHGKGMYINPAGEILMGLFRAGSIVGGSEVPLHAPTYECDFDGLSDWLTARFGLKINEDLENEEDLLAITKRFLPYIRLLYHRAGEFSHKYGNHGLYPAYLKKGTSQFDLNVLLNQHTSVDSRSSHNARIHKKDEEPDHMKAKVEKPETLDGVFPVTRFGLWLLIRDCDNVLDEVTMAYYDKIWSETPPISFQTKHNPFEPIYLRQFLQVLITTAVAYYIDIPRKFDTTATQTTPVTAEEVGISETTLNEGISYDEHKRQLIARRHRARKAQPEAKIATEVAVKGKVSRKKKESVGVAVPEDEKEKHHNHKGKHGLGTSIKPKKSVFRNKSKSVAVTDSQKHDTTDNGERRNSKTSKKSRGKSLLHDESHSPIRMSHDGKHGDPEETADELSSLENEEVGENEEEDEEEEEELDINMLIPKTIAECYEKFMHDKLLPCLRRTAGDNLPAVPQPLPALVDMYEAFKSIKNRDILRGTEFLRASLPHLLFPNPKDALWWHRCPEPLSPNVNFEELLDTLHEKFPRFESQSGVAGTGDGNGESEFLGEQAQKKSGTAIKIIGMSKDNPKGQGSEEQNALLNNLFGDSDNQNPDAEDHEKTRKKGHGVGDVDLVSEFIQDSHPFANEELVPEPFLWADDYKCVPAQRKYQHFENIGVQDVMNVLDTLYPKLGQGRLEMDLHFQLVFCDWLWCNSLLAKFSTEREFQDAWKPSVESVRPISNPQSLGVYAHYIKQIQNNPYLSLNPPKDFKPKEKVHKGAEVPDKSVKFSAVSK